jgi:hypothetical protein
MNLAGAAKFAFLVLARHPPRQARHAQKMPEAKAEAGAR